MSNIIPYIIEREMLHHRGVSLPEVGTIYLRRESALFVEGSDELIYPPYDTLALDKNYPGSDIIALTVAYLKESSNISGYFDDEQFEVNAQNLYREWYNQSISDDGSLLSIDGICTLDLRAEGSIFSTVDTFEALLMPYGDGYVAIGSPIYSSEQEQVIEQVAQEEGSEVSQLNLRIEQLEAELRGVRRKTSARESEIRRRQRPVERRVPKTPLYIVIVSLVVLLGATAYIVSEYLKGNL